ncbi:hypothetical protein F5141DRAFT_791707 [Pisolithus sp. B1]|nr:hypothetical protein F5141DRAFT_791707 [Pisolithus sp. B1]
MYLTRTCVAATHWTQRCVASRTAELTLPSPYNMKFSVTTLVLGLVSAVLGQETLTINTPTAAYYCEPLLITWAGGVGPYNLVYLIGGSTPIPGHEFFATDVPGYSYEWTVSVSYCECLVFIPPVDAYKLSDTPIALVVQDSTGTTAESATFTVEYGTCS